MTPFGHLAVALLLARWRGYAGRALALCLAGTVLPDLVDKPLVVLGVAPIGHTVGHSVLVLGAAGLVVAATGSRTAAPFLAGWTAHLGADLIVAYPKFLVNFAWPVLGPRPTPDDPLLAYWLDYALGPLGALELAVVAAALVLTLRRRRLDRDGGIAGR